MPVPRLGSEEGSELQGGGGEATLALEGESGREESSSSGEE